MKQVSLQKREQLEGIMIVNKPKGMTSHDVVSCVRRRFKMRRVGHAGTLDPLATGVLVILLGRSTKLFKKFEACDKAYRATLIMGTQTTTADIEGDVIKQLPYDHVDRMQIEECMKGFIGEIEQIPPMVSAVKVNGKRLYQLARQGIEVKREPRLIHIKDLKLLSLDLPNMEFSLECSKGTYVRKLAEDIAEKLNCVACISQIERTRVGPFSIEESVSLDDISEEHIRHHSM